MQFVQLVDYPQYFPLVAQWNWEEWGHLLVQRSAQEFEGWLRTNLRRDAVPMTLLALSAGHPIGTVSIMDHDLEIRPEFSPWLASLYVLPAHRRRGLGRSLVAAATDAAHRLRIPALHLYTPGQESFYAALGWERVEVYRYRGGDVTIMRRALP